MKHTCLACVLAVLAGCQATDAGHALVPGWTGGSVAVRAPVTGGVRALLLPPLAEPGQPPELVIDLSTALARAGVDNPSIALALEAVRASQSQQLQAQALLLPTLSVGGSFDWHQGNLLTSQGVIDNVQRQSAFAGAGAGVVGAGTVGFPGVFLAAHLGDAVYEPVAARFQVAGREFDAQAERNQVLLQVANTHLALAGAQARHKAQQQSVADFGELAKVTASFAKAGQGRDADSDRASAEMLLQETALKTIEEEISDAAAELARLLSADLGVRLRAPAGNMPMLELVDLREGLEALVQVAMLNRPEIAARTADVAVVETRWKKEKIRPLLPVVAVGFSAGGFGGGGSQADSNFGNFSGRTDFDATAFWSLQNFGFGNLAVQHRLCAQVGEATALRARAVDAVRAEVTDAFALASARRREVDVGLRRLETAQRAFQQDLTRARNLVDGRPIEVLDSARLLGTARQEYLRALVGFNQAQMQLFVSLGQPPSVEH